MNNKSLMILIVSLFSVALGSSELDTAYYDSDCPVWTYRHNSTSPCQCGSTVNGRIECNLTSGLLSLRLCFCLTYDNTTNHSVAGYCPYSCATDIDTPVHYVHMDKTSFSDMCEVWKREGPLCSRCQPNHGIPLYSYNSMTCVECPHFQLDKISRNVAGSNNSFVHSCDDTSSPRYSSSLECVCACSTSHVGPIFTPNIIWCTSQI